MEVETEDGIGVEHQPAPLVRRQIGAQDLADRDERRRQVEVVVERSHEPVVQRAPLGGQRRDRLVCAGP